MNYLKKIFRMLNLNQETSNYIKSETEEVKNYLRTKYLTKEDINKLLNENIEILQKEINTKLVNEINDLKNKISLIESRGEEMNKELNNETIKILDSIKEIRKEQVNSSDFHKEFKSQFNSFEKSIIKIIENNFQEKSKLENIEKDYKNILDEKNSKLEKLEIELNKYNSGLKPVKNLIDSIEKIEPIKNNFYQKFKLVENDYTNNIIKIALESNNEVIRSSLMYFREIKLKNSEEITSQEVAFYGAINDFYGSEMILVERLSDQTIDSSYWDVKENTSKFKKKIFPPINTGKSILKGVAQGEY